MSYLEDYEDKAYICPYCGSDEPIIESSEIKGNRWRGGIKCGVCCLSYKRAREFIPIEKYRELKKWIDNKAARENEEGELFRLVDEILEEEMSIALEESHQKHAAFEEFYYNQWKGDCTTEH